MRELAVFLALVGSVIADLRGDPSLIAAALLLGCSAGFSLSRS